MAGINKVILLGNLGKDPEIRSLENGTMVAKFPLATSETYKNRNGEKVETTEWHNIVMWRGLAEIAEKYLRKGSKIYIEGKIRTRSYDDKDGNKKYITEIEADNMLMLDGRSDRSDAGAMPTYEPSVSSPTTPSAPLPDSLEPDDLPF
ncbi:MAG: single-stranded DNA-binding protein [Flavobacteriales bacterium]|nr:single-stranded DNA-binding protein [Flavobacteriales bacterium]